MSARWSSTAVTTRRNIQPCKAAFTGRLSLSRIRPSAGTLSSSNYRTTAYGTHAGRDRLRPSLALRGVLHEASHREGARLRWSGCAGGCSSLLPPGRSSAVAGARVHPCSTTADSAHLHAGALQPLDSAHHGPTRAPRPCRAIRVRATRGSSRAALGPVNTIGRFVISLLDGAHRDAVRTHRALPPATAWQCQHAQFAGAQRDPVRRRAGVQVARVAEALWELAHDLHPYESLVQERGARPGLRTPATRPVDPYQAGCGSSSSAAESVSAAARQEAIGSVTAW